MSALSDILNLAAKRIEAPPANNRELADLLRVVATNNRESTDSALLDAAKMVTQMDKRRNPTWGDGNNAALASMVRTVFLTASPQSVRDGLRTEREREETDRMNGQEHGQYDDADHDHVVDAAQGVLTEAGVSAWGFGNADLDDAKAMGRGQTDTAAEKFVDGVFRKVATA